MASVLQNNLNQVLGTLRTVTRGPDSLHAMIEKLRPEMEVPSQPNGVPGFRQAPGKNLSWRSGVVHSAPQPSKTSYYSRSSASSAGQGSAPVMPGKYVSPFVSSGSINDKILTSVIGNKLNSFSEQTYADTRDFIYQILDSGETEFIREFLEKVFKKATFEDKYCALFAKLIAEIAHKYPVMYDEVRRYHTEFIKVFDDIEESGTDVKKRQHRMGYGEFISELVGQNALEKEMLIQMIVKIGDKIWEHTAEQDKVKTVEECIDCLTRLSGQLKTKSPKFFASVKGDIESRILEKVVLLIQKKAGDRPSLSLKAKCGLMDLRDILVE